MIEEHALDAAIAACKGEEDPNAWTAMRLAAFLYLKKEMFGTPEQLPAEPRGFAFAAAPQPQPPADEIIQYSSQTEFGEAIDGKPAADIWPIIDEIMSVVQVMHPQIYKTYMSKIK